MTTARQQIENLWDRGYPVAPLLDAMHAQILADAVARVATLPTANQGQLIAATREQILDAIGGAR
jgi:hypothetical protein